MDYTSALKNVIIETESIATAKNSFAPGNTYRYTHGLSEISVVYDGTKLWHHHDRLGSTRFMTASDGKVAAYVDYDAWGVPGHSVLKGDDRELDLVTEYTGHPWDAVLGLYFAEARMYDAGDREFVTKDQVKGLVMSPGSLTGYVYCSNNPLKYIDPTGNAGTMPEFIDDGGGGGYAKNEEDFSIYTPEGVTLLLSDLTYGQLEAIANFYGVKFNVDLSQDVVAQTSDIKNKVIQAVNNELSAAIPGDAYRKWATVVKFLQTDMSKYASGLKFADVSMLAYKFRTGKLNFFEIQTLLEMGSLFDFGKGPTYVPTQNWSDFLFLTDPHLPSYYTHEELVEVLDVFKKANYGPVPSEISLGDYAEDWLTFIDVFYKSARGGIYFYQFQCGVLFAEGTAQMILFRLRMNYPLPLDIFGSKYNYSNPPTPDNWDGLGKLDWSNSSDGGQTSLQHVNEHATPNYNKPSHGVFRGDPKTMVEQAWANRGSVTPVWRGGGYVYNIPYPGAGYQSGYMNFGQQMDYITIVTNPGTSLVWSAYPSFGNIGMSLTP